ncbi:MAG: hypothetical protein MUC87_03125 [Bacteroidia bacterium]|jgi:hypothetical protein|nr:hypothetical protein [Bacteroidia bacterium]
MKGTGLFSWVLLLTAALFYSCSGGSGASFKLLSHVAIEETDEVFRSPPLHIISTGPHQIAVKIDRKLHIYDTQTGKSIRHFTGNDSLHNLLRKLSWPYDSARSLIYLPPDTSAQEDDLFRPFYGVSTFHFQSGTFYINYIISIPWYYSTIEKTAEFMTGSGGSSAETVNTLLKLPNARPEDFIGLGNAQFIIETDSLFNIRTISYINEAGMKDARGKQTVPMWDKGFLLYENEFYVCAHTDDKIFSLPDSMPVTAKDSFSLIGKLNRGACISWQQLLLGTADITEYRTCAREHVSRMHPMKLINGKVIVQTIAGWYTVPEKKKYPLQPVYSENETLFGDFDIQKNILLYSVRREKIKADTAIQFRVYDAQAAKTVFDTTMTGGGFFGTQAATYYFINRSGEKYYIDTYQLTVQ